MTNVGIRQSITDLQAEYDSGNKAPLENLMRAWHGIKNLPPEDLNSFFVIGGFHGEPFNGEGATNPNWWGGYCQHGTVLFPTWHRAYLYRLEKALQSIAGCESVNLPFWDECSTDSQQNGIPRALTDQYFELDGKQIDNPLRSFTLPVAINDLIPDDLPNYSKPKGYETVRYPLSGLVGSPQDREMTLAHNRQYSDYPTNVSLLDGNIKAWLNGTVTIAGRNWGEIHARFVQCLDVTNYTQFSNTTSSPSDSPRMPLESPHNYIHLAVGGYDYPVGPNAGDISVIPNANGDMGENDTAGLDPIFFFHHCFIDYTFWIWQQRQSAMQGIPIEETVTIDPNDPGAKYNPPNSLPPNGSNPDDKISLDTALDPFTKADGTPVTSRDVINIETQLGYSYGPGSLDEYKDGTKEGLHSPLADAAPGQVVHVSGIDRSKVKGSFLITAHANVGGERRYLGSYPILSRWHVGGCANCMNHLRVNAAFALPEEAANALRGLKADAVGGEEPAVEVSLHTRHGLLGGKRAALLAAKAGDAASPALLGTGGVETIAQLDADTPAFTVEIR